MLYNMLGVIIQPINPNVLFEGFDLEHKKDNNLYGRMHDVYGPSAIQGHLDLSIGEMKFNKKYDGDKRVIEYKFEKQKHLWVGEFGRNGSFEGESYCELFKPGENSKFNWEKILYNAQISIRGAEKWSKDFTQQMIDEGWFEEIVDEETGEKVLKPSNNPPYKIN